MQIFTYTEFKKRYDVNFKVKKEDPDFLGQGGYGAVYKGRDLARHFDVAIKRSLTDKNLLQEIERGKNVPIHPNIARYIDGFRVETDSDDYDIAILQYYAFGNLDQLISKLSLSEAQIDEILKGILLGLQFLHDGFKDDKGEHIRIIHRDLKPQNILISEYAGKFTPLITDFGISKTVHKEDYLSTGSGVENSGDGGTIVYKAPEQIANGKIRTNLDLWAFGVMLFKILKKRLPFFSDADPRTDVFKLQVMQQIQDADIDVILSQLSDQSHKYQMIVKSCLVRDIKQRVQTAQGLIDILDEIPDKLAIANNLLANNEYEKAKEKFEELLQIKPNYSPAQKGLKDCGDLEKEESNLIEKLEIAYNFLNEKKYKEAQENFETVLKKRPNQENALKGLEECKVFFQQEKEVDEKIAIANRLLNVGNYAEAKTNFDAVLVLRPKQEVALKGIKVCEEAIKKTKDISTKLSIAKKLFQEHKYHEAKSQFEAVLGLDSDNIEAKEGIGNCEGEIIREELPTDEGLTMGQIFAQFSEVFNDNVEEELPTDVAKETVKKSVDDFPTDEAMPNAKTSPKKETFVTEPEIDYFIINPEKIKVGEIVNIAWRVIGSPDEINIKSSNTSFDKKNTEQQGQISVVVQNETVFTLEVIYGKSKKTKSGKVEAITAKNPINQSLWDKLKIPVSVIGTSIVLYFGYTQLNQPKPVISDNQVVIDTQELVEKAKREREAKATKGDSLFEIGNEQLDNGTDKMIVSNTFREAINFKPALRGDVYKLFMGKADKLKGTAPAVSEKYRKLADEFEINKSTIESKKKDEEVFVAPDIQAEFPGGITKYNKFLQENLKYPSAAQRANVEGKVFVQFVVNTDGSIQSVEAIKSVGFGCDEEAVRVIKLSKKWVPAMLDGKSIRSRFTVPINFKLN